MLTFYSGKPEKRSEYLGEVNVDMEDNITMNLKRYLGVRMWAQNLTSSAITGFPSRTLFRGLCQNTL
jgi:hypothetical protein